MESRTLHEAAVKLPVIVLLALHVCPYLEEAADACLQIEEQAQIAAVMCAEIKLENGAGRGGARL